MAANDGLGTAARVLHDCSLGDTAATGASARDPGARADLTITPGKVTGGQHGRAGPAGPIRSRGRARAREHTSRTVSRAMAIQRDCRPLILGHAPSTSDFAGAPSGSDVRRRTTAARRLGRCQPRTCLLHNGAMYASIWECAPATGRHQPTSLRYPTVTRASARSPGVRGTGLNHCDGLDLKQQVLIHKLAYLYKGASWPMGTEEFLANRIDGGSLGDITHEHRDLNDV